MKRRILYIIGVLLFMGLCAYFSISAYMKYRDDYISTYVASHQLNQRSKLTLEDLEEVLVPKEYLSSDVLIRKEDILDKYVKLSYSIPKGSLFYKGALENDIVDKSFNLLMDNQINYDIYVSEVKINTGNLLVNMYVDLYLTINTNDKPVSDLLIQDCRITGLFDPNGKNINDYDHESRISIVSIAIDKDDVPYLNKALLVGNISVTASSNPYAINLRSSLNSKSNIFTFLE